MQPSSPSRLLTTVLAASAPWRCSPEQRSALRRLSSVLRSLPFLALPALALAQGVLTPVGGPQESMRALDQIEPRQVIGRVGGSTATLYISSPGSYVLQGDVTVSSGDGIVINADHVTLDLNGFTISSTEATPTGFGIRLGSSVTISGRGTIYHSAVGSCIRNGTITGGVVYQEDLPADHYVGPGFLHGIAVDHPDAQIGTRVEQVVVTGVDRSGINLGRINAGGLLNNDSTAVIACTVRVCGGPGIAANLVKECNVAECGQSAVNALVAENCTANTHDTYGILAKSASNCFGQSTSGYGIYADSVVGCYGTSLTGSGIVSSGTVTGSYAYSTSSIALQAANATNCVGDSSGAAAGIQISGTASFCNASSASGPAITGNHAFACHTRRGEIATTYKDFCH